MKSSSYSQKTGRFARILIWTIHNQDLLAHHIRIYSWSSVAIILLLTLSNAISLETALHALLICGLVLGFGLWIVIERRRSWLLSIQDPEVKRKAYLAMLAYMARKTRGPRQWAPPLASNLGKAKGKMEQKNGSYL